MSYEVPEDQQEQWEQEHDLRIIWKCSTPGCNFEYSDRRGYNEARPCPECGGQTRQAGEEYC